MRQLVFSCDDVAERARTKLVLGGKGLSLVEMKDLGVPVPPWFTITTSACRATALEGGRWPKRLAWQLKDALSKLETSMGRKFGDPTAPLLVSVRSGAAASMPGMMDTILNLGMTPSVMAGLRKSHGEAFAQDTYRRFLEVFGEVALECSFARVRANSSGETDAKFWIAKYREVIKRKLDRQVDDPVEQLALAVVMVMRSWLSERAVAYRASQGIPGWWGTAVTVQSMVFGNAPGFSGTGVVFSANTTTGEPGLCGDWLEKAQGEDVVSGKHNASPISALSRVAPSIYEALVHHVAVLEKYYSDIVDVEFTVENGKLWILQARVAKRTAKAAAAELVRRVYSKQMTKQAAAAALTPAQVEALQAVVITPAAMKELEGSSLCLATGEGVSGGAVQGVLAATSEQAQSQKAKGLRPILVRPDTSPDDLPGMIASVGIITCVGGATSHAAVVARGMDIACVVGASDILAVTSAGVAFRSGGPLVPGSNVTLDPASGKLFSGAVSLSAAEATWQTTHLLRWYASQAVGKWPAPAMRIMWNANRAASTMLIDFYMMEAMFRDSRKAGTQMLRNEIASTRQVLAADMAEFLTGYLAISCGAELRHAEPPTKANKIHAEWKQYMARLGWAGSPVDRGPVQTAIGTVLSRLGKDKHIEFFRFAERIFGLSGWSSGYGGKKWQGIAAVGRMFLTGEIPHVIAIDHAFDLQHNGGPVFDKNDGMIPFNRNLLVTLLNAKKHATGSAAVLSAALGAVMPGRRNIAPMSPKVLDLWNKGLRVGVWKTK